MLQQIRTLSIVAACVLAKTVVAAPPSSPPESVPASIRNTETSATPRMSPAEAIDQLRMPDGFRATMFAAEPRVRQPIAIATDPRDRLWVAENETYAEQPTGFSDAFEDRIVILEDTDADGRADKRTVFASELRKLSSVEVGLGGVWALCPPQLLFIPDADGDDRPDGPPQVMLDGWNADAVRHNLVNGLRWGPDGWLYGRHGILATSHVGTPDTPPDQRTKLNCGIWRFHPTRREFEVVAHGTTNPWGMDWDEHGQLFFINTVIGHLWHVVRGAHFERMYGDDFNPYVYDLIPQTADHVHWDTREAWNDIRELGVTPTTDEAGGGHAHSGLVIYQGGNWPAPYRGNVFTANFHGRRLNRDLLRRRGAGYAASHGPDFATFGDPWFRGVDLLSGGDGGLYVADWSDAGECHDNDGIHRDSGRIYKIGFGELRPSTVNLGQLSDRRLAEFQQDNNDWYARQSRNVLRARFVAGQDMTDATDALEALYAAAATPVVRLRALWTLHQIGAIDTEWLIGQLDDNDEHLRVWVVKLLGDYGAWSGAAARKTAVDIAESDPSGLVLLHLASELQRFPIDDRWPMAEKLALRDEFARDPMYSRMLWYAIEPAVPEMPIEAVQLAETTRVPLVRRLIVRRLAADLATNPEPLARFAAILDRPGDERQLDVLEGMTAAVRGWRRATPPAGWSAALRRLSSHDDALRRQRARELLVVFGDGRAIDELRELAADPDAPVDERRAAIRSLVASRDARTAKLLRVLLNDRDVAAASVRGLAAFADPESPQRILRSFARFRDDARAEAINTLASRPAFARPLLAAVAAGQIRSQEVPAYPIRQMWSFGDEEIRDQIQQLWPGLRHTPEEKADKIEAYRRLLTESRLATADRSRGRVLFGRTCGGCHRLFGQGQNLGPDLTGGQRHNLMYLLQNIVDPSLQVAEDYRMSTVILADGRTLNGLVTARTEPIIKVQTPSENHALPRDDVIELIDSKLSMMPENLLDRLTSEQISDLIAYVMSPHQVPLPSPPR